MANDWEDGFKTPNPNVRNSISQIRYFHEVMLREFRGNLLGMIEPSVYVSCHSVFEFSPLFNYHLHAIVWEISEAQLDRFCRKIRQDYDALVINATAADVRPIKDGDFLQMVWYVCKMPFEQHQIYKSPSSGRWRQFSGKMQPINAVRIYSDMRHFDLDELLIAKGRGEEIEEKLRNDAARCRLETRERDRLARIEGWPDARIE